MLEQQTGKKRPSWSFKNRKPSLDPKNGGNSSSAKSRLSFCSSDDDGSPWVQILADQQVTGIDDSMTSRPSPTPHDSPIKTTSLISSIRTNSTATNTTATTSPSRGSTRGMLQSEALSASARESIEELTTLHFGRQLQGRSHEMRQLKAAYLRVGMDRGSESDKLDNSTEANKGRPELILISGESGTGKSVLARELKNVYQGNCFHGKFDMQQDPNDQHSISSGETSKTQEPFSAVLDAYELLCAHLYCKCPEADQVMLQKQLLQAFGDISDDDATNQTTDSSQHSNVLVSMIPSLRKLLHKGRKQQLGLQEHDTADVVGPGSKFGDGAQSHRLTYLFRCLTRIASHYLKPLVLVIDDLQWADVASLSVLTKLLTDDDSPHFLLIGTYRDDPNSEYTSVVQPWVDNLKAEIGEKATTNVEEIHLDNFAVSDVNALISRVLKSERHDTRILSEIIHRKTHGNPFFVVQFITTLRDLGILDLSLATMEWKWDEPRVEEVFVTDNVLQEILRVKMRNLSTFGRFLSQVAACIGTTFTQDLLFIGARAVQNDDADVKSLEFSEKGISDCIQLLLTEGIFEHCWSEDEISSSNLRFAHDQIEAAAAEMLSWETTWQLKAALAKAMLQSKYARDSKWLYVIADLCNEGHSHSLVMDDIEIKRMVVDVNHRAGVKAMESCAYSAAIQYLEVALSLLDDHGTEQLSPLDLHTLAAHAGYCSGNFRSMQMHLDVVLNNSGDIPFASKLPAYVTLVLSHIAQTQWIESIKVGLDVLRHLGFKLPQQPTSSRILLEFVKTKVLIGSRSFDDLCNLPLLHDETAMYTERIFDALATATYTMKSEFFPLLTLLHVQMCIRRGVGTHSPVAFATYGIIVGPKMGHLKEGYKMGEIATAILSRLPNKSSTSRTIFLIHQFVSHWVKPAFRNIKISYEGYRVGLRAGDVESALYNRMSVALFSWACGQKLEFVEQESRKVSMESYEYRQRNVRSVIEPYWQQVLNLMGRSVDPLTLVGEAMSEGRVLADPNCYLFEGLNMYSLKLQLVYILGGSVDAMEENLDKSKLLPELAIGSIQAQRHMFYEGAVAFFLAINQTGRRRRKWKKHGLKIKRKIERWLGQGHVNTTHAIPLYEAELQVLKGNRAKAKKLYEESIRLASKNGYQQDRALAHERAGVNFLALGDSYWATYHLSSSRDCYLKWGAQAKVRQMEDKYLDLCMLDITDRLGVSDQDSSTVKA